MRARTRCVIRVVAALGTSVAAVVLPAVTAGAVVSGPCTGAIKGADVAPLSASDPDDAIEVGEKEDVVVGATSQQQIERYKVLMGQTEMTGPGIVLTLSDSKMSTQVRPEDVEQFILHDYDIQRVVNELRVAGAEVISINGQRVVERTAIRCVGPVAHVNNSPVTSPFVITAIGDPEVLYGGLMIANGIVDWLRSLTFPVTVEKRAHLRVPAYSGSVQLRNARPVVPAPPRPAASEGEGKS